jgi:hypothetical protein
LRDTQAFVAGLGIRHLGADPTMTHQCMVTFAGNEDRDAARGRLEAFRYEDGSAVFDFPDHVTDRALYFGPVRPNAGQGETILDKSNGGRQPVGNLLYELDGTKSGCHHPVGALWIRTGAHRKHEQRASILDTFPTLVELIGAGLPARAERRGASLLPLLAERSAAA